MKYLSDTSTWKQPGVYQILNSKNGKVYIGSSNNPRKRYRKHKYSFNAGIHSKRLQADYDIYGASVFSFQVLEACACEELITLEQLYIEKLKPQYNNSLLDPRKPHLGAKHTAETIALMCSTRKAYYAEKQNIRSGFVTPSKTAVKISKSLMSYKLLEKDGDSIILRIDEAADFLGVKLWAIHSAISRHKKIDGYTITKAKKHDH